MIATKGFIELAFQGITELTKEQALEAIIVFGVNGIEMKWTSGEPTSIEIKGLNYMFFIVNK